MQNKYVLVVRCEACKQYDAFKYHKKLKRGTARLSTYCYACGNTTDRRVCGMLEVLA